jgi:anti-sigma regulatory factor (Ser/Thr protein kinase)
VERIADVPGHGAAPPAEEAPPAGTPQPVAEHAASAPVEPALPIPWQALDGLGLALRLPHDSNSAAALRHSVGGLAFALGLARAIVADVRLALTEISGALLRSVPDGAEGDLEVDVRVRGTRLEVRLLDRGAVMPGMPEHPLSLALVAALTDAVKIRRPPEGGVEVLVSFTLGPRPPARG